MVVPTVMNIHIWILAHMALVHSPLVVVVAAAVVAAAAVAVVAEDKKLYKFGHKKLIWNFE